MLSWSAILVVILGLMLHSEVRVVAMLKVQGGRRTTLMRAPMLLLVRQLNWNVDELLVDKVPRWVLIPQILISLLLWLIVAQHCCSIGRLCSNNFTLISYRS